MWLRPVIDLWIATIFQEIPYCVKCEKTKEEIEEKKKPAKGIYEDEGEEFAVGVMKPDIVFFGEGLPDAFHEQLQEDKSKVRGNGRSGRGKLDERVWLGRSGCGKLDERV